MKHTLDTVWQRRGTSWIALRKSRDRADDKVNAAPPHS